MILVYVDFSAEHCSLNWFNWISTHRNVGDLATRDYRLQELSGSFNIDFINEFPGRK